MKSKMTLSFILVGFTSFAVAAVDAEIDRFVRMSEVARSEGVGGLLRGAADERWIAPEIPSRWRLASAPDGDTRRLWEAARSFGLVIAQRLERDASALRDTAAGGVMSLQGLEHADFAHWVAATQGYGNGFLARRSADLAAVACARLAADMGVDLRESSRLAARLRGTWETAEWRTAVLNLEVGRSLFGGVKPGWPIAPWDHGIYALSHRKLPEQARVGLPVVNADVAAVADFFADDRVPERSPPSTLVSGWESKRHAPFAIGLELRNVEQAIALVEFRSVIGFFPEKLVIRPPTKEQQIAIDWSKEWEKKHGVDPRVKIVPAYSHYKSEREAAFAQIWHEKIRETSDLNHPDHNRRLNRNVAPLSIKKLKTSHNGKLEKQPGNGADRNPHEKNADDIDDRHPTASSLPATPKP
jgi:hypothetical protein